MDNNDDDDVVALLSFVVGLSENPSSGVLHCTSLSLSICRSEREIERRIKKRLKIIIIL